MTIAEQSDAYLPDDKADRIRHVITETWRGRHGVGRVIEAAFSEQRPLSTLVAEFDSAVHSLNERWLRNPSANTSHLWNIRSLDWFLARKGIELPRLQRSPAYCDVDEANSLVGSLCDMAPLMERAEQGLPEPKLTFAANGELSREEALLGGTIQFAGRYLAMQLGERPERFIEVWRGGMDMAETELSTVIMDALLEVPIANQNPLHYGYFRTAQAMGWYEASGPFSPAVAAHATNPSIEL